jgi:hypothetical protein
MDSKILAIPGCELSFRNFRGSQSCSDFRLASSGSRILREIGDKGNSTKTRLALFGNTFHLPGDQFRSVLAA